MERLNLHMYEELQKEYEVYLVGPKGAGAFCDNPGQVLESQSLPVWRFLILSFLQALWLILKHRPALLIAGSGVAALPALLAGRMGCVPVLTYLHGLDIIAPNALYQWFFLPAIRRSQGWMVNSRNTQRLAVNAGIPPDKIEILHPGTSLPNLSEFDGGRAFRRRIGADGRLILLSVGRLTRRKGLLEFIQQAMPVIVQQYPEVLLLVIGGEAVHSVAGSTREVRKSLNACIASLGLERNVLFLGNVDDRTLSEAYLASQLHVFPILDLPGDVEGFGMVAVEAAAHGLPTVGFSVGGVADAVVEGKSGWIVGAGDYPCMVDIILRHLSSKEQTDKEACLRVAEAFSWNHFGSKLRVNIRNAILNL